MPTTFSLSPTITPEHANRHDPSETERGEDERQHRTDRCGVSAVGEHADAGGERGEPVEVRERLLVEFGKRMRACLPIGFLGACLPQG